MNKNGNRNQNGKRSARAVQGPYPEESGPLLRKNALLLVLIAVFIMFTLMNPYFLTTRNMMTILRSCSMNGIIALGMTLVIISREIDLSVGSLAAFSGCLAAWLVRCLGRHRLPRRPFRPDGGRADPVRHPVGRPKRRNDRDFLGDHRRGVPFGRHREDFRHHFWGFSSWALCSTA